MPPLRILCRLLLTALFFSFVNSSHSQVRHQKRRTHHKFPDDNVVVGLHHADEDEGSWGEWSDSSECSRSCGGGVAVQTRRCNDVSRDNGSSACKGPSKRYISCNIQDCSESSQDFREVQCAKFDSIPFGGKYFRWVPYKKGFNECELNCMPHGGDKFYYRHSQAVVDGTRCREDSLDICVQGVCMAVGCDMMLGSNVVEDKCQECGGDGSNCKTVEGIFDQKNLHVGYNDIILIPAGATTIKIKEMEPTNNYLAIRNSSGHYYLNGNWQIEFPRKLRFAGTHFNYEREQKGFVTLESIQASGPTTEPIYISLLYQQRNLGISYEYSVPLGISNTQPDNYGWQYSKFGACSQSCGGGIQTRIISCATSVSNEVVPDYLCNVAAKPADNQKCNEHSCPAHWEVSAWDECSSQCGGGVQYRQVHCHHQAHDGMTIVAPDSECAANDGPKPVYARACNDDPCATWRLGEWTKCKQICGEEDQTRAVSCVLKLGEHEKAVNSSLCPSDVPPSTRKCIIRPCEGTEWIVSQWSGCHNTCGLNSESREAHCASIEGHLHPDDMCSGKSKPPVRKPCESHSHCEAMWHASEWSECSAKCGSGIKTRMVFCGSWKGSEVVKVSDHQCPEDTKMLTMEECHSRPCPGVWFTGPWTRCSVPCGGGQQSRKVMCLLDNSIVSHSHCDVTLQPYDSEPCNMHPCDEDEVMLVSNCHKSKYGCCSDGITPADPGHENCSTGGKHCKETEFGCCMDGTTPASGPFEKGCPKPGKCSEAEFGCCPDGMTPAKTEDKLDCAVDCENSLWGCCPDGFTLAEGKDYEGCYLSHRDCRDTKFGCCPDGTTSATGTNYEGCDFELSSGEDCLYSTHGCCPDGLTSAEGPNMQGCPKPEVFSSRSDCSTSAYGCCQDGVRASQGPNFDGCDVTDEDEGSGEFESSCRATLYGCCRDGSSPAKGPNHSGCPDTSGYDTVTPIDADGGKLFLCSVSQFGCCKDGISSATGPNFDGCPEEDHSFSSHCSNTVFGCCPDGVTSAQGPNKQGCCALTEHGCCPDNITMAVGPRYHGCDCHTFAHGCCPDGVTTAKGPRLEGCQCEHSEHGCCQDSYSYAKGPNYEGCNCSTMLYGCCLDNITPARGLYGDGCDCQFLHYGCCPDSVTPATGHHFAGCSCKTFPHGCCPDGKTVARGQNVEDCPCNATSYGCCPDHKTAARGPYNEGCPCQAHAYGCCPDNKTPALGPDYVGCPCMIMPFGCCPDKQMVASGPHFKGCPCKSMEYGCCPDGETAATGELYVGCPCTTFPYGCCPDGVTPARDQNFGGCKDTKKVLKNLVTVDVCRMPKERGPCHNFSVKWYFDMTYGGCSRFWYGGCDGNGNQFSSQEDCEKVCVNPVGPEACMLPKVVGPCKGAYQSWYYEPKTDSCNSFNYSGCLGNNNRYATQEICENTCVQQAIVDACDQPMDVGPCKKVTQRWFYDKTEGLCKPFIFGGCKGNGNNFESEKGCLQKCIMEKPKDLATVYNATVGSQVTIVCKGVPQSADDEPVLFLWYKGDSAYPIHGIDRREGAGGMNMVSTRGTDPRFSVHDSDHMTALTIHKIRQEDEGDYRCRVDFKIGSTINKFFKLIIAEPTTCHLPQAVGNCYHFRERWFYNAADRRCKRFYYSGCGGNENNFATHIECEKQCEKTSTSHPEEDFRIESCSAEPDAGPCKGRKIQWFYDEDGVCKQFYYGGCRGNGNRFNTKKECELKCASSQDICQLPKIRGPCSGAFPQWFFDREKQECFEFYYSGCQGNANRFNDKESCEGQCRKWPSEDVQPSKGTCSQPKDPGPCLGYFLMWYHDDYDNTCRNFVYGGCHGNSNRFGTLEECQAKCHASNRYTIPKPRQVQSLTAEASFKTNEDICRQPPDEGHCSDSQSRWYYDPHKLMCLPFVFKGCGGNKNRFKSSDLCFRFCSGVQDVVRDAAAEDTTPQTTHSCPISNCEHLQCPHGMEEIVDAKGCMSCFCSNPCENHSCPEGTQCVVEKHRHAEGEFRSQPLCRLKLKQGQCPETSSEPNLNDTCHDRCQSDADCPGGLKCCYVSCAQICILPATSDEADVDENDIEDVGVPSPTRIVRARKDIAVKVGEPALLRCIVKGYPTPKVTWFQNNIPLGTDDVGYKISVDGSLHIMTTSESNSGIYTCTADNGVGKPVTRFFNLIVYEDTKVSITLATEQYQVGSPLQLDCKVTGTSPIEVTWHIGRDTAPLHSDDHRTIFSNHTLYISSAQYNASGSYICQARNQHGQASDSFDVQVHDVPIPSSCKDSPFFTSCAMIVEHHYCINPTYAKFCCKSCAISGQLQRVNTVQS